MAPNGRPVTFALKGFPEKTQSPSKLAPEGPSLPLDLEEEQEIITFGCNPLRESRRCDEICSAPRVTGRV